MLQPLGSIFKFSPKSPGQNPGLQQEAAILIASLSRAGKQSRSYHQSHCLIFILFHPSCTSVGQSQAYPCSLALPFWTASREGQASPYSSLHLPVVANRVFSQNHNKDPGHSCMVGHIFLAVFFHIAPGRSLTWHQHPWLTPLLFWAQELFNQQELNIRKVLRLERILFLLYTKKACFWFVRQVSFTQACSTCTQLILFSACLQSGCRSTSIWSGLYS